MKMTNHHGLPTPVIDAIERQRAKYHRPDHWLLSVTQSLKPGQVNKLSAAHWRDVTEDYSDRLYALYGQIIHEILACCNDGSEVEFPVEGEFLGETIGGHVDRLTPEGVLQDWKMVSTWEFTGLYGLKREKVEQLNVYAELCRINGKEVDRLEIVQFFRDFSKTQAKRSEPGRYPIVGFDVVPVEIWPRETVRDFIESRIEVFRRDDFTDCTDEERWIRYSVMIDGLKTPKKNADTMEEAEAWVRETYPDGVDPKGRKVLIQKKPPTRCLDYCSVRPFCSQFARDQ